MAERTKLAARAAIGPFSDLDIHGSLCAGSGCDKQGLIASAELDAHLIFFEAIGLVEIELTDAEQRVYFQFSVAFCGFGVALDFRGLMADGVVSTA